MAKNHSDLKELAPLLDAVPKELHDVFKEIVALTDAFCREHLNEEYLQLCRRMAVAICQEGLPVVRGKRAAWACGIVYSVGWVNFLTDPEQQPHLRAEEIAKGLGVSTSTMHKRAKEIREGLDLMPLDPEFSLPSRAEKNPFNWIIEVNGLLIDLRHAPRELQEVAYENGLIPFIPGESNTLDALKLHQPPESSSQIPSASDTVYQFKITLVGSKPPIWRRIQVKDGTLNELHEHIQTAMGWTNSHLHDFKIGSQLYSDSKLFDDDFGDSETLDSTTTRISEIVPPQKRKFRFYYEYDFGDGWEHEILLEKSFEPEAGVAYPRCLEGERACPPEDVGGIWGYYDFLDAINDPKHERHAEFMEWGEGFDPGEFSVEEATQAMQKGLPEWGEEE